MTPLLTIENLSIRRQNTCICDKLSLQILQGQCWGLLGSNGRGKSTLFHTLIGLLANFKGDIFLEGSNLLSLSRKFIAQRIGILLQQEPFYFPVSIYETIRVGRYAFKKQLSDSARLEELLEFFDLNHLKHKNIVTLSGGEQQRTRIARLCYQNPLVLLLDEPLNHLDFHYQKKLGDLLKTICDQGKAVFVAGHHLAFMEATCSHFLLFLKDGNFISGPKSEVLTAKNLEQL
jgi:iron complex transport system ATP-binding protein